MKIKGTFYFKWSEANIGTHCELNPETGELFPTVIKVGDLGCLESEEFVAGNETYKVCPLCHEFILKTVIGDRADLSYGEYTECMNPNCDFA